MQLRAYLDASGISYEDFATEIAVSPEAVRLWVTGARRPRAAHLSAIRRATEDAVQPNDFFDGTEAPEPAETGEAA